MGVFPTANEGSRKEKGRQGEREVCWRIKVLVSADEWAKGIEDFKDMEKG